MSYIRNQELVDERQKDGAPVSFEMVSGSSGRLIYQTTDPDEVVDLAHVYKADPEIVFEGISRTGHLVDSWTVKEVLDGTFEACLRT